MTGLHRRQSRSVRGLFAVELRSVAAIELVELIQKCANTVNMPNQIHGYNLIRAINIRISF